MCLTIILPCLNSSKERLNLQHLLRHQCKRWHSPCLTLIHSSVRLQVGPPFAGVTISLNGLQWHSVSAESVSEATIDTMAEADAKQWLQKSCRMLRCSMTLHAQAGHEMLPLLSGHL